MTNLTMNTDAEPLSEDDLRVRPTVADKKKNDSALAMKRAFFRMGIGETDDGVRTHCRNKALRLLKGHVLDAIVDDKKNADKFNFTAVPLECFGKTMDDLLVAFLAWSKIEDDDECYDVSEAFKRLGEYATWMHLRRDELRGITNDSIQTARKAWNIMTSQDRSGRVVWWLDLATVEGLKELTAQDSLQYFVWFAHDLIFRHQVQTHGLNIVINLGQMNLVSFVSMVPPSLTRKLEKFTINILPIMTKQMYVMGSPTWCSVFLKLTRPFIAEEMRQRMITVQKSKQLHNDFGIDCIPEGFGKSVKEIASERYLGKEQLLIPREIFHGRSTLVLPDEPPEQLLREWGSSS